jgi:hypothetical protein
MASRALSTRFRILLQLGGIRLYESLCLARQHSQRDIFTNQSGQHVVKVRYLDPQLDKLGLKYLFAAEGEELGGQ